MATHKGHNEQWCKHIKHDDYEELISSGCNITRQGWVMTCPQPYANTSQIVVPRSWRSCPICGASRPLSDRQIMMKAQEAVTREAHAPLRDRNVPLRPPPSRVLQWNKNDKGGRYPQHLTSKQKKVAYLLIVCNMSNKQVAAALRLSIKTVQKHRQAIYDFCRKTGWLFVREPSPISVGRWLVQAGYITMEEFCYGPQANHQEL